MTHRPRLLLAVAVLLASLLTLAAAQSVDPSFYYKLSTQFRGNGMKLDVFNGGPKNNLTRLEPDQRRREKQPATPRQLRELHGPSLEHHDNGGWRLGPADDEVSRPRHVPGYFQRWREQQPATPRQLHQLHGPALDADEDRQGRGGRTLDRLSLAGVLLRRISLVLAQRVSSFRCTNAVAIGGEADIPRTRRTCCSAALDPKRSLRGPFCCNARH